MTESSVEELCNKYREARQKLFRSLGLDPDNNNYEILYHGDSPWYFDYVVATFHVQTKNDMHCYKMEDGQPPPFGEILTVFTSALRGVKLVHILQTSKRSKEPLVW